VTILYITFFLFYWSVYFGGNLLSLLLLFGSYSLWRSYLKQPFYFSGNLDIGIILGIVNLVLKVSFHSYTNSNNI